MRRLLRWASRYLSGESAHALIGLIVEKLSYEPAKDDNLTSYIAPLLVRMPFKLPPDNEATLVERHLRACVGYTSSMVVKTMAPSEPVVALAAQQAMRLEGFELAKALECTLNMDSNDSYISGIAVAQAIVLATIDATILKGD